MPIKDWPEADRPRDKLFMHGERALTDAELIAIFIKTGVRGKTALDLAKELLMEHGSLKKLLNASATNVIRKKGMGEAKYAALRAAIEIGRRYFHVTLPVGIKLNNSCHTRQFLADRLRDHPNEVFGCLFMDTHFRLICFEELFHGSVNEANVYPREIVRRGIAHNAAKIILAHNHPSGLATPSRADREVTTVIQQALALINIDVVDHIIIGNPDIFSFAEAGYLVA